MRKNQNIFLDGDKAAIGQYSSSNPLLEGAAEEKGMTYNETYRPKCGAINGSTPSETQAVTDVEAAPTAYQPLVFDPQEFMQFVEDEKLSEAEAVALLKAIWDIVVAFVDLGFGLNPVQQALVDRSRNGNETQSPQRAKVISSKDQFKKTGTNLTAKRPSAKRQRRRIHDL